MQDTQNLPAHVERSRESQLASRPPRVSGGEASSTRASAARILALARRRRGASARLKHGRLRAFERAVTAPARAAREALTALRRYGKVTAEDAGISPARQFAWMWWLNLRHAYTSEAVYRYRLFSRDRVSPAPAFLQIPDALILFRTVTPRVARAAAETLADKRRFARWCAEQHLPTAPILMEFERGEVTRGDVPDGDIPDGDIPRTDLFAKWGTQYGGGDTQRWRYEDGGYVDDEGRAWRFGEIVELLTARSQQGVVLLQPCLVNHPSLRPLSPNALSTVRVMTTQRPGAAPRFLAGILRMGTGSATADNFAQGGIASVADPDTGVVGAARRVDKEHRTFVYQTHPDTGAAIAGSRVPLWPEVVRLALDAHARLGPIPCVGWDVAVLEGGPVLLEGNWNPCTKLTQVATQTPLLATEFADTYAAWLDEPACAFDDRYLVGQVNWGPV